MNSENEVVTDKEPVQILNGRQNNLLQEEQLLPNEVKLLHPKIQLTHENILVGLLAEIKPISINGSARFTLGRKTGNKACDCCNNKALAANCQRETMGPMPKV